MGFTFDSLVDALVSETNIPEASWPAGMIATVIMQAEGMIYRDLSFLSTMVSDATGSASANQRQFTLPRHFTVLHSVNRVDGNDRVPLTKVSRQAIDMLHPSTVSGAVSDIPVKWAPLTDQIILLGPVAGATTQLVCVGEVLPETLSASNPETWLSEWLGDLLLAAAMVHASGYMRNFGAQADNPQMAVSWKGVYDALLPAARSDEMRRKYTAMVGAA